MEDEISRGSGEIDGIAVNHEVSQLRMTSEMSKRATLDSPAIPVIIYGGPRLNAPCLEFKRSDKMCTHVSRLEFNRYGV